MSNQRGFSLFELFAVIMIMAVTIAIAVPLFRSRGRETQLRRQAQIVQLDLRRAQTKALSTERFGGIIPYGYGIYFSQSEKKQYVLFADLDNDLNYDSQTELVERIALEGGLEAWTLKRDGVSVTTLTVFFCPPIPTVFINGSGYNCNGTSGAEAKITLGITDNLSHTKTVRATTAGLITVE